MVTALSMANRESELSYAYLHAIAAHAGVNCKIGNRHDDNSGVDAELSAWGDFPGGGPLTEVDIKVQLKATIKAPTETADHFSYFLSGLSQYDDLRSETFATPRILAVLFLPRDEESWVVHSPEQLTLKKCAYWVSLRGAQASTNSSGETIYLPKSQAFNSIGLMNLISRISRRDIPNYELPK
ncbi:DUF4365 domain-containing protein [Pseudomonas oryzihabitans]|uniref:DUF4365 domain-containing protein n=1 Tax=Pseudomonas oryzihabitans TaxID=47885 RepID=UPI003F9991A1